MPRIPIESWEVDRNYGLDRGQPSPGAMATILTEYYNNRELLEDDGIWCWERMHEDELTWPFIQKQMLDIVERTLSAPKAEEPESFSRTVRID